MNARRFVLQRRLMSGAFVLAGLLLGTGTSNALPLQQAFTDAGLGSMSGWTNLAPGTFGSGGTYPYFAEGGTVTFGLQQADFGHRFGTTGNTASSGGGLAPFNAIFDTSVDPVGTTKTFAPVGNPFAFFFQNTGAPAQWITSMGNDNGFNQLGFAVYQNNANPSLFAFFFDDGGGLTFDDPADDNDFNDMVITVSPAAAVPEPASVLLLGAGLVGLAARLKKRNTT